MTPRRAFNLEGADIALVQNRLQIAALCLTALVFSGSFTLALFGSLYRGQEADFRREFLHIETALALGIISSLASIACLLQSQQSRQGEQDEPGQPVARWYVTGQWWFSLGQLFLYMSLSQALSASLTEIVYAVSLSATVLGAALGVFASLVWWAFLFFEPIAFLRRMHVHQSAGERRALRAVYVLMLSIIFVATGAAYRARGGGSFVRNIVQQLYQPLVWHKSW